MGFPSQKHNPKIPGYIDALKLLTPREVEVLELVGKGFTRKEVADQLGISPATIKKHKGNISKKLNLNGYNNLMKWYINTLSDGA